MKKEEMQVFVLFVFSTKTGKVSSTITATGPALLKIAALNMTKSSKSSIIVERNTGKVVFFAEGKKNDFPNVFEDDLGYCNEYGIPKETVKEIKDDRFDKEDK